MNSQQKQQWGMFLGFVGVFIFAATLPMTRLATGFGGSPQLSAEFITFGRASVAGILSIVYLLITRSQWLKPQHIAPLLIAACGNVLGYSFFLSMALRQVEASHAAVVVGILPLATATIASWVLGQRPSLGFWLCSILGCSLVLLYLWLKGGGHSWIPQLADLYLLMAVLCAATGYVFGAKVTPDLGAEGVICWMLVLTLPVCLPLAIYYWPSTAIRSASWWGFTYVSVFSMWIGFFAWYRGLDWGGTVRVSQALLLQPFFSMLFATFLLNEVLDSLTLGFAFAVILTVFIGRKMPIRQAT